jgi:uncharacterized membrane protein YhaH (DUF805 family)
MTWLSPNGRLDRAEFLIGLGAVLMTALLLDLVLAALPGVDEALILSGVWVVLAWPLTCLLVRRFRDAGSGPRALWLFAPQALVAVLSLLMSAQLPGPVLIAFSLVGAAANLICWGALVWLAARPSVGS